MEAGVNTNVEDERGITPLLLAGSTVTQEDPNEMSKFVRIVEYLVQGKASTNAVHPDTGNNLKTECSSSKVILSNEI